MSQPSITHSPAVALVAAATEAVYDYIERHGPSADVCIPTAVALMCYHLTPGAGWTRWVVTFTTNDDERDVIAVVTNQQDGVLCAPYLATFDPAHTARYAEIVARLATFAREREAA